MVLADVQRNKFCIEPALSLVLILLLHQMVAPTIAPVGLSLMKLPAAFCSFTVASSIA
jgi:hypothetical protein